MCECLINFSSFGYSARAYQLELASARKTFLLCITLTPRAAQRAQAEACKQLSDSVR